MKQRIIAALKACAKAHKAECNVYDEDEDDVQVAIMTNKLPAYADVCSIVEAFYGTSDVIVKNDTTFNCIEVLLDYLPMQDEVDEELLKMALPRGTRV